MKIRKLLFIATLFFLALPLVMTGNAMAKYRGDGAVQDATTGAWEIADPGQCYVKDTATTGHIDATATGRTACYAIPAAVLVSADCTAADGTTAWWKGRFSGGICTGNWVYNNNYVANSGNNSAAGDREGCLHCHNAGRMEGSSAGANKTNYMMTGHKNMLRKVTVGTPHLGPDGVPYADAGAGTSINWTTGQITTATGTWDLKWIYGDWMAPGVSAMYLDGTKNMGYSCSKCHATGTSIDNTINAAKLPVSDGTLASTDIGTGVGQIKLDVALAGYTADHYASWDQWGIMCSRCHSSASAPETAGITTQAACTTAGYVWVVPGHGSAYCTNYDNERIKWNPDYTDPANAAGKNIALLSTHAGGPSDGPTVVRMCGECHRQEVNGQPYTFVGDINGTAWNKGFGDQAQTVIGGLSHGTPAPAVGHNYMNVFLNGSHGKFTGTYAQITDSTKYASKFMKATADGGLGEAGCMGCHNVHESIAVEGHEPFENECTSCHQNTADTVSPQVTIGNINHPSGVGTPLANVATNPSTACESCHMPGALHLFRINTDPTYVTKADYTITGPDNTADDNGYASAVWVDLQQACGQCHGGSAGVAGVTNNAPYFSNANISQYAQAMHGGACVGANCPTTPPVVKTVDQCTSGSNPSAVGVLDVTDATVGQTVTLTDASSADGSLFINWGDGSALATGTVGGANTHSYGHIGRYQVVQTVKNACGYSAQNIQIVNVTGGTNGKGTLKIDMAGTAGLTFSYSVMNNGSSTSITNGHITIAGSKVITLDGGNYDVKIGYPSVMPLTDPLTYHSCDITVGGTAIGVTGQLITGLSVAPGVETLVSLTNCN